MLCWLSVGVSVTQTWVRSLALPLHSATSDKVPEPYLSVGALAGKRRTQEQPTVSWRVVTAFQ